MMNQLRLLFLNHQVQKASFFSWMIFAVMFLSGCSDEGPERVSVSGTVTLDGEPLTGAVIAFSPEGEVKGPRATARIIDGQYQLEEDNGPLVGEMKVEINSEGIEESKFQAVLKEGKNPVIMKVEIPRQYNERTRLKVETKSGDENVFDFKLDGKKK